MPWPSLITPPPLATGDTIGLVSPSAGVDPRVRHRILQAVATLESMGYKMKIGAHALEKQGYVSGSIADRLRDLHASFADPEVRLIMCTIGGNNSNQLIKFVDYDLIRRNPKIFIGYSDITVLHYALASQAGLATYYGPCAMTQFGEYPRILEYTLRHLDLALGSESAGKPYRVEPSDTWTNEFLDWFAQADRLRPRRLESNLGHEWLRAGAAEGPALGGAILSINHLAGTRYWLDPTGTIFFLDILKTHEELNEAAIDALLTDMDHLGVFDVIAGLVVGRLADCTAEETGRIRDRLMTLAGNKKYPILWNANIGHTDPIITVRYGRRIRLDAARDEFAFV